WGQSMQDDITDGANWLVENGYADANRLAILGGSYGGYAALMGAVKTPDLYQCAVSFAGVTDLPARLKRIRAYIGGRAAEQYIGNLWTDRDKLRENSPALQADKITKPILLIHGEDDRIVDVNQSRKMRGALKRRNKDFKYIELPNGSHGLRTYKNRLTFLKETEAFLSDCLDG
ncbi:MAG: prolyl oligopeptidase family serine peptidase, partial [Pseudomonadota bacterium]